jgi:hypothetical protein
MFYVESNGRYHVYDCVYDVKREDYAPGFTMHVLPVDALEAAPAWLRVDDAAVDRALRAISTRHVH